MKGLSSRERRLIAVAAGVALIVGVPGLLLAPPQAARKGVRSLAEEKREQGEVRASVAVARREVDELEAGLERRLFAGTPRDLVSRMVGAAHSAAGKAGMRLNDLKPMPVESAAGLRRVPVRVSFTAPFAPAARFLYEVERGGSRFRVDQVQMTATDLKSDQLEVEMRLVGYVRGEGENAGAD